MNEEENKNKYIHRPKTLIFCGTAKLPENVTAKHVFGHLSVELEIDPVDFKIVDVSCTLLPALGEKILCNSLIGYRIEEGIKNSIAEIEDRFFSSTKRAVIAAIEDVHKRYTDYIREEGFRKQK